MATQIDLSTWPRAEHFEFFKNLTDPYFSVCVRLNAGELYQASKAQNASFYLACLYSATQAVNAYEPMCVRIENGKPYRTSQVEANAVQLDEQNLFKIAYLPYSTDFSEFSRLGKAAFGRAVSAPLVSRDFKENEGRLNCFHVSVLPWLDFTSFSHATMFGEQNGIPKLVFGQFNKSSSTLPFNIDVHHSLMDGFHVAQFIKVLQQELDTLAATIASA